MEEVSKSEDKVAELSNMVEIANALPSSSASDANSDSDRSTTPSPNNNILSQDIIMVCVILLFISRAQFADIFSPPPQQSCISALPGAYKIEWLYHLCIFIFIVVFNPVFHVHRPV